MLERNTLRDSRAVGLFDPGKVALRGNNPSPETSIAIGKFATLAQLNKNWIPFTGVLG
jgi:hypothetical protein